MITLNPYAQRDRHAFAERARLRGLAEEAREARSELATCVVDLVHALANLREAGIPKGYVWDAAAGLKDAITDRDHALRADIDAADATGPWGPLHPAEPIDLSDLNDLIEECR